MFEIIEVTQPGHIGIIGWKVFEIFSPEGFPLCKVLGENDAMKLLNVLNKDWEH